MTERATKVEDVWHVLSDELRSFLRLRLPSDADADDLLQDVFVRVLEKLESLRETDRIEAWIFQIARNAITDFYRRTSKRITEPSVETPSPVTTDFERNENLAVGSWLATSIDLLPIKLADAVHMYEIDGLSQADIADQLHISLSGVKSRVRRGRKRLGDLLRDCCRLELDKRGNVIECQPLIEGCCTPACGCDRTG